MYSILKFLTIFTFVYFFNFEGLYFMQGKKVTWVFYVIPEVLYDQLQKLKKTCDHNSGLSNGSLITEQNAIFMLFLGSTTQQNFFFISIFLAKVLCYCSIYDFNPFKIFFARVWALIGPKERSEPNFSEIYLTIPRLARNFWEK